MATATELDTIMNLGEILQNLGGISPTRIRMFHPFRTAKEADLIAFNDRKDTLCEMVDGLLVEKGMGYPESALTVVIARYLGLFISSHNLGVLSGASGMMRLASGLVRMPDLAYSSWNQMPGRRRTQEEIAGFAPDLAVEVLSKSNTRAEMVRKRREYFEAGVRLVWMVDPKARTVTVHDAPDRSVVLDQSQILDGGDVLPGFTLALADVFGELDRHGD